ncbi:MAG: S-layer homology domain-containing protein, partial [Acidimicrobiaceae bacterium]|nr:S-layer homology domain-containing protein [Acidimicrobiaceae bacterium]
MAAVLAAGIGFLLLGGVASSSSSITVTQGDFTLTCPSNTVAEGATLSCTLTNTSAEAKPWPVVAILHLSTDADRALVRGASIDVTLGTPSPTATIDGGVTWIGDTLVGYSRFDWSGNAGADPTQTTTTVGAPGNSRTVSIVAGQDTFDEDSETFYVALGPDGSKGVGLLYNNKTSVTVTDDDSASTDVSLSSLSMFAGQSLTLSATEASQSKTVAYGVTEATLTAEAAHGEATMTMSASFGGSSLDLDGRGATSIDVLSGQQSAAVPLAVGTTTVTLTVAAEDGTTTGTHTVSVVREELGDASTVSVSVRFFTLTCPAEVAKATVVRCTLTATAPHVWPVVAVLHSSADGASRALVAEDPIIPDTDPVYSKDVALGDDQPPREALNHGYGELFSGGSRSVYRTYGYEKFDLTGRATLANRTVEITIELKDNVANSGGVDEVFYVALAESGYTGLSQLVDNMVPILLKELPAARSVAAQNIKSTSAEVAVEARNPDGTLHLRYRAGTSGSWSETSETASASPVTFSLSGLTAETQYQVQASFDDDFEIGVRSGSFTTTVAPSVSSVSPGSITQTSATITVAVADPEGSTLHLRHQADGATTWTESSQTASSSPVTFSLSSLTAGTTYNVEASFDSDFSTKSTASFTTTPPPSVSSVSAGSITYQSATATVAVANPDGTSVRLRRQPDGATTWITETPKAASSSPVTFSLTGLTAATTYTLEASFDSDFSTKAAATFTTKSAPSVSSVTASGITYQSATVRLAVSNLEEDATVFLRYRVGSSGSWTTTSAQASSSSPGTFVLDNLQASTEYQMQASFSSTFTTGVASGTFTTEAPPPPSVSSVEIGSITHSSATITVEVDDADGSLLYLRRRVYPSGSWSSTSKASASTTTFSLTGLSAETDYDVEVSFDSDFEDAQLQYFQTLERPEGTRGPTGPSGPTGPGPTGGGGAPPPEPEPEPEPEAPRFTDVDESSVHAADIEALYAAGITLGCPSQQGLQFCPDQPVTRAQMATFLARALNLTAPETRAGFTDVDESSVHAADIEALY